ncbi:hypothetical protein GPALN_006643 [Globodera pallida]|nr:hypothetical protein GPALN_006643 [Globodera pallida]
MIEHGLPEDRERIVRSLQGDIMKNACAHFGHGSHGLPEDRERIVRSLQGDIMKNAHENRSWRFRFNKFKLFVWRFCITAAKMYPRVRLSRDPSGVGIGGQSVTN